MSAESWALSPALERQFGGWITPRDPVKWWHRQATSLLATSPLADIITAAEQRGRHEALTEAAAAIDTAEEWHSSRYLRDWLLSRAEDEARA